MARCISPWTKDGVPLPCGKCINCLKRRASGWGFRLSKEAERSSSAFFVTLTYDNENVPITKNGFMTLDKKDVMLWIRYLRRRNPNKIKYYLAGEYGGETNRPHYHVILFNAELDVLVKGKEGKMLKNGLLDLNGEMPFKSPDWNKGHITIGKMNPATTAYTLKYISKPTRIPMHSRDDRQKEFSLMSKKMGANYMTEAAKKWHKADIENRLYVTTKDGIKIPLPRYFREKIYSKHQLQRIYAAIGRKEKHHVENKLKTNPEEYLQELENENKIALEKQRKLERTKKKGKL